MGDWCRVTPNERQALLKLIYRVRALNESEAHCFCGRHYRLMFDADLTEELNVAEAVIEALPTTWLEIE